MAIYFLLSGILPLMPCTTRPDSRLLGGATVVLGQSKKGWIMPMKETRHSVWVLVIVTKVHELVTKRTLVVARFSTNHTGMSHLDRSM